jgi:3-deoxy-D-manno-octulosonic-acid transferase
MSLLALYRGLTLAAGPFAPLYLAWRVRHGKEDSLRLAERFGQVARARPAGRLLWIHAASVGEAASMLALVDRLLATRRISVLITTGTVSSARLIANHAGRDGRILHQYAPLDHPRYVREFIDHWRPDLALWVESELWPNLIGAAHAREIPLVLLNARISARSYAGWLKLPGLIRPVLSSFDLCLAQDPVHAERLIRLGARRALFVGDLKSAAAPLPVADAALTLLTRQIAGRPVWLAASTHDGEEAVAADAHLTVKREMPDILTVIVPRHPARGETIARMLGDKGLAVARRGRADAIRPDTDIYLADTLGELGLFYRLAGIAFIGGSLVPMGGHNPYEAARLDCAILHGPDMSNPAGIARALAAAAASETVRDKTELAGSVIRLLRDPEERARRAAAALAVADASGAVLDTVMGHLTPWLDRLAVHAEPVPA